jgi:hypothetical protein
MERIKIQLLAAKTESVYGTDPVPTPAANLIDTVGNSIALQVLSEKADRVITDAGYGRLAPAITKKHMQVRFRVELRGNRTNGTAADISAGAIAQALQINALLLACDLAATYTAEASSGSRDGQVLYRPTVPTGVGSSVTIYWWTELKLHKLTGAKGTFDLTFEAGKPAYMEFTFTGIYNAPTDVAISTLSPTHLHIKPPLLVSSTATFNSYAAIFNRVSLALNNTVSRRDSVLSPEGIVGFMITDRAPSGSIDPEAVTEAAHPFWANFAAESSLDVQLTLGTLAGNKFSMGVHCLPTDNNYGERNGGRIHQINFDVVQQSLTGTPGTELQLVWS